MVVNTGFREKAFPYTSMGGNLFYSARSPFQSVAARTFMPVYLASDIRCNTVPWLSSDFREKRC